MESHCFYAGFHDQNDETNLLQLPVRCEYMQLVHQDPTILQVHLSG